GVRLLLGSLRALILLGIAFMLLEMVIVITKPELVPSRLLVLMDTSESMSLGDPYSDDSTAREAAERLGLRTADDQPDLALLRQRSRLEHARRVVGEALDKLKQGREISIYGFDSQLKPLAAERNAVQDLDELRAEGAATGIGDALAGALAAHRGQPLAGILLATDGRSNSGADPRDVAAQAGKDDVPIVSLALGTLEGPRNARLADIEASPVIFIRDPVDISVLIESRGLKDVAASVALEQRQEDGSWREVGREQTLLGEDAMLKRVNFRITPEALGHVDYRASVSDVGPELSADDNSDTVSIRVVRERIRVLLVAGYPSPEVQFLRNALLRDNALEFASWLQSAEQAYENVGHRPIRRLPANQKELDQYDVLVLFDPDMRGLGPAWPEMIAKFVGEAGGGLIYVAGELGSQKLFSPAAGDGSELGIGGADSSWLKILPVVRDPGLYQSSADVRLSSRETWTLELSPEGAADAVFQFAAEGGRNREILASLPGMYWHFPVTRAKPGAVVLARHGDPRMRNQFGRHVLMATQLYGPGRTVFIGFDSTYRWRYLHEEYFDGFWARLIDRVGRSKVLGGRYPFTLATDKSAYRVGDRVTVRAELLESSAEASAISELRGEVEWGPETSQPLAFEPLAEDASVLEAAFTASEAGAYTARVVPSSAGDLESGLRPATLAFRVEPPHAERDNPTLDRPLLEDIARASGGSVLSITEREKLPAAFRTHQVTRTLEHRDEVWDAPLLCGGVMLLLTLEWLLRKKYRMA
ncbi:MAG TPA: hypothetical protein VGN42_19745, partial [Pirellulales bacterium]|nr:hypothetical protein [Pirellulales bacterium]